MLIIAGTIRIEKPATEEVLEACRNMMEATHQEDGCIDYVFSVDPIDPTVLHVMVKPKKILSIKVLHFSKWTQWMNKKRRGSWIAHLQIPPPTGPDAADA